jgi:hypothetical protein
MKDITQRLDAMKAVYCYFLPETRPLLKEVEMALPDDMWFVSTKADDVEKSIETLFDPPLNIPATEDGRVNIDEIHVPIIERIVNAYDGVISGLDGFAKRYPTSGSSEGIFHLLTQYKIKGTEEINLLESEYEGYSAYASHLGMKVNWVNPDKEDISKVKPGLWFISNPSARDGNIIPNEFINELCENNHKVVLDFAYVGATKKYNFDVSHPNIEAVAMSFSKPYGVFRFRIGGFTFAKEEVQSLFGNKWFKDTTRLMQSLKLAEEIGPENIYPKYRPVQEEIITELNSEYGLGLKASDSFLLAHLKEEDTVNFTKDQMELIAPFKRGPNYRLCLTPYFEAKENMGRI